MPSRRKRPQPELADPPAASSAGDKDDRPVYIGLSANRIIAYNLAQARAARQLTQQQAAELLEPYLGARWSKATFSAAERSLTSTKIRNFDADEIVAFAQGFDLPITYFFIPPPPTADGITRYLETAPRAAQIEPVALLLDLIFGTPANQGLLTLRMKGFLHALPSQSDLLSDAQQRIASYTRQRLSNLIHHALSDIATKEHALRSLANQLEDLRIKAGDLSTVSLLRTGNAGSDLPNEGQVEPEI